MAQLFVDGGIAGGKFGRPRQIRDRLFRLMAIIKQFAQIEKRLGVDGVLPLPLDCDLEGCLSLFEVV